MLRRWRSGATARRLLNEGVEHRREGRLSQAEVAFASALEAARASGDTGLLDECATRVANSKWRQRRFAEASQAWDEVIAVRSSRAGPHSERTIQALEAAIDVQCEWGRPAAAEPYCRRRLESETKVNGRNSARWAYAATTLAWSLREQGRLEEAEALYKQAIEILEAQGATRPRVGWPLAGLAVLEQTRGNHDGAHDLLVRARDAWDRDGRTALASAASERLIDLFLDAGRIDYALSESNRFFERTTHGRVDERVRLRRTERHIRVLRAAGREAEAKRFELRVTYLRAALSQEREEEAAARLRAGEGPVPIEGDQKALGADPAGPVYPLRI